MLRTNWIRRLMGLVLVALFAVTGTAKEPRKQHPLIELIQQQQAVCVGESYGQWAHECFTWRNLETFNREDVPGKIVKKLKEDAEFADLVAQIQEMTPSARSELLRQAAGTYKPTWAQLGRISPAGQTDAGQQAERRVAAAIVGLVRQLLAGPQADN